MSSPLQDTLFVENRKASLIGSAERPSLPQASGEIFTVDVKREINHHEDPVNTETPSQAAGSTARPLCEFYAKGRWCKFGRRCRFLHERTRGQYPTIRDANVNATLSTKRNFKNGEGKGGRQESSTEGKHETPKEVTKEKYHSKRQDNLEHGKDKTVCKYFMRYGRCHFGAKCTYLHSRNSATHQKLSTPRLDDKTGVINLNAEDNQIHVTVSTSNRNGKTKKVPTCRFFKSGGCYKGDQCKYWHPPSPFGDINSEFVAHGEMRCSKNDLLWGTKRPPVPSPTQQAVRPVPVRPQMEIPLENACDEDLKKMRNTEIQMLRKRYPKVELLNTKKGEQYKFTFVPTDPDWPYDVKGLLIMVLFPEKYPRDIMQVSLPDGTQLPDTVRRYIQNQIKDWLNERHQKLTKCNAAEMVFRPFLRWLDKTLEDIFTCGLKLYKRELIAEASGIQFISASQLQEKYQLSSSDEEDCNKESESNLPEEKTEGENKQEEGEQHVGAQHQSINPTKKGTEVKLHNLQLKENAATLILTFVNMTIQCSRCKNKYDVKTTPSRLLSIPCPKCHGEQLMTFRQAMAHQFSSVIGYVDLSGCLAFDVILPDCHFAVGCLSCNKEMELQGLSLGQLKETWCRYCHAKMKVAADAVRFLQLQPGDELDGIKADQINTGQHKKVVKDPAIQEGKHLPEFGTCKHYKKSYRWLRFPCCGKAYPCDVCHNENEPDHEMKFANRMICGHCCKEQPYAVEKPCVSCKESMTKHKSIHWEGGKGCRDKIMMSRNDDKKYSNMNKTISKKSQSAGKKKIKLRHAKK